MVQAMRLAVYGAGAIGSWFGAALETGGQEVTLVGRPTHVEAVNAHGLIVDDKVSGTTHTIRFFRPALTSMPTGENFDAIIITTKTYALSAAVELLAPALEKVPVCILQNGIGNEEIFLARCPRTQIIRVLTSHGVIFKEPGRVVHTGLGSTFIGVSTKNTETSVKVNDRVDKIVKNLAEAWNAGGIPFQIVPDITKRVWEKVFVNLGINPFGAIARVINGELLTEPLIRAAMEGAVREAVAIAQRKGVDLTGIDPVGTMFDVARKTRDNRNSMLQDIEKGKPTEILFMNGKIVEWGKQLQIPTPINSTLTALVQLLERQAR
ncbi:MAG: 2-dehydropantoate 2-reductase [Promethearchaeota archaeon CR_4]|nr:MAG: 2-dehydropantoate 2-reductase [Candidatus Lokiarchaeota archaeon CR_4]